MNVGTFKLQDLWGLGAPLYIIYVICYPDPPVETDTGL